MPETQEYAAPGQYRGPERRPNGYAPAPVSPYQTAPVSPYQTAPVSPYPASPVGPYQAAPVSAYPASPASPYQAAPVSAYPASPVGPYQAAPVSGGAHDDFETVQPSAPRSPAEGGGYPSAQRSVQRRTTVRGLEFTDSRSGRPHRWVAALAGVGAIMLIAMLAVGATFLIKDEQGSRSGATNAAASQAPERDISSRDVDPNPLTEAEVFPSDQIAPAANEEPYTVLKKQTSDDCRTAAADQLGTLLTDAGCSQVVRATLRHPSGKYFITAGMFNLADQASADQAHAGIKPTVDAQKGRFTVMPAGTGTEAIVRAPTQLGWNVRGHFLTYCVIARADGQPFAAGDQFPKQIIFDLIETYLDNEIIGARAVGSPPDIQSQPDPTPSS